MNNLFATSKHPETGHSEAAGLFGAFRTFPGPFLHLNGVHPGVHVLS